MKTTRAAPEPSDTIQCGNVPRVVGPRQPALPEDVSSPSPDVPTAVSWALRVAGGTTLASSGVAAVEPVLTAFAHAPIGHALHGAWFPTVIGMALVASGAMVTFNKLVPLAMTLLVPVSMHLLFQLNG